MKILKLKSILFNLVAITLATVFLSACEQDYPDVDNNNSVAEKTTDNITMPEGHLSVDLNLRDENNPENGALISISTNNEEIFGQLSADNFKTEFVSLADLEKSADENIENVDKTSGDVDESSLNTEEHFLSIKVVEENAGDEKHVKYTLGDDLLAALKKYKAQTHIQFNTGSNDSGSAKSGAFDVYKNAFTAYGDGGVVSTKVRVYYDYGCSGALYYKTTDYGFLNSYTFKSCNYPYVRSDRKRYTYFTVTQDVLNSFSVFNTSSCENCEGGSTAGNNTGSTTGSNTTNSSCGYVEREFSVTPYNASIKYDAGNYSILIYRQPKAPYSCSEIASYIEQGATVTITKEARGYVYINNRGWVLESHINKCSSNSVNLNGYRNGSPLIDLKVGDCARNYSQRVIIPNLTFKRTNIVTTNDCSSAYKTVKFDLDLTYRISNGDLRIDQLVIILKEGILEGISTGGLKYVLANYGQNRYYAQTPIVSNPLGDYLYINNFESYGIYMLDFEFSSFGSCSGEFVIRFDGT